MKKKEKNQTENSTEIIKKKEKFSFKKIAEILKKKWLIDSSKTIILFLIIIGLFIGISVLMKKLDFTPIDLTEDKLFTLTEESKEKVKDINTEVRLYFIGFQEEDSTLDLAKEYSKVNDKISVECVSTTDRPDLVQKYSLDESSVGIIVETDKRYKVLSTSDLYTQDTTSYETINIAEEKLTASIKSVSVEELPKVYFLKGYSSFSLENGMQYLNMYLQNEVNEVDSLDILSVGKVPDDCNTLVITSPESDFDDQTTNAIMEYINKGGNILWLNAALAQNKEFPHIASILEIYGVKPFTAGVIRETEADKMVANTPELIMPEIENSKVTSKLVNSEGLILVNATKINTVDENDFLGLNVDVSYLVRSGSKSYFRTDFTITSDSKMENEEEDSFVIGGLFDKTIQKENEETGEKAIKSKLIIYGENIFASDYQLSQSMPAPLVVYRKNKDLVLNSIAFLSDREEDITVRKTTGTVTYTASEKENKIILTIIFSVPTIIILTGIIVWIKRKKQK